MDPVTVIGLVSSLITIIETGKKAIDVCREIKKNGMTASNADRTHVAKLLTNSTAILSSRINSCSAAISAEDKQLLEVSERCRKLAIALQDKIAAVHDAKSSPLRQMLKLVIKNPEIVKMETQLKEYSSIVDSVFIKRLASQSFLQLQHNDAIDDQMRAILAAISKGASTVDELRLKLRADIEAASGVIIEHQESSVLEITQQMQQHSLKTQNLITQQNSANLANTADAAKAQALLDSLSFQEMFFREREVTDAEDVSCDFIFNAVMVGRGYIEETGDSEFSQWLRKDQPLVWITGKAGTGKSVIMKYAFHHQRTSQSLLQWANEGEEAVATAANRPTTAVSVVLLRHFFWKPGSNLQHSLLGLLQSLLWQLMQHGENVNGKTLLERYEHVKQPFFQVRIWTLSQVKALFEQAMANLPESVYTCIFIDALDECVDEAVVTFNLITFLSEHPRVKVCVSSRPEEFTIALQRMVSIRLDSINGGAIYVTAKTKLLPLLEQQYPDEDPSQFDDVIERILYGSEGVFLWAVLVIKETNRAIEVGEGLEEVIRIIANDTPTNIAELFQQMIDKIHPRYMDEMSQIFSILSVYDKGWWLCRPTLLTLFFINNEISSHFESDDWEYFESEEFEKKCTALQTRLEICASGLIEISPYYSWPMQMVPTGYGGGYEEANLENAEDSLLRFCRNVSFVHRSVGELLFVGDGSSFIRSQGADWLQQALRAGIHCTLGFIGLIPILPCPDIIQASLPMFLDWLAQMLRQLEAARESSTADADLVPRIYAVCKSVSCRLSTDLEFAERTFPQEWTHGVDFSQNRLKEFDISCFAAYLGAHQYLTHWISSTTPSEASLTVALWYAVTGWNYIDESAASIAISKLLDAGADPNQPFQPVILKLALDHDRHMQLQSSKALSPWELFISRSSHFYTPTSLYHYDDIALAISTFIAKGANLHTTSLTTTSMILQGGHMPTFVIEISPLSFLSSADAADWSPNDTDTSLRRTILQGHEGLNAPSHMRIRAFKYVLPNSFYTRREKDENKRREEDERDEESERDQDVKHDRNIQGPKNANIYDEDNNPENDENIRNLDSENIEDDEYTKAAYRFLDSGWYILSTDDSQALLDLVLKFFPKFPANVFIDSDMEKMLNDAEFLNFFRSRSHVHSKETIILPPWFEPGVDGSVGQAKPED